MKARMKAAELLKADENREDLVAKLAFLKVLRADSLEATLPRDAF
jgi:hypothetical protein